MQAGNRRNETDMGGGAGGGVSRTARNSTTLLGGKLSLAMVLNSKALPDRSGCTVL